MKKLMIWIKNLFKRREKPKMAIEYYKPAIIPTGMSQSEHLSRNIGEYRESKKPLSYSWGIPEGYVGGIDPYQDNTTPNDVNVSNHFSGFGGGNFGGGGAGGDWGSSSDSSSSFSYDSGSSSSYDSGSSSYDSGSSYDSSSSSSD